MATEKRVVDGQETEVNVEVVDGNEVVTPVVPVETEQSKDLSQGSFDKIWKKMKETEEKLAISEESKVELVDRIKKIEEAQAPVVEPGVKVYGQQSNGTIVYPDTEEEWDELIATRPSFGTSLHYQYINTTNTKQTAFETSVLNSALKVAKDILPDMYKKDSEGNLLLTKEGRPVPDQTSDLFKIYCQVAGEQGPIVHEAKDGPELIALKVQQVLGTDKETQLKKQAENEAAETEAKRLKQVADGKVAPPGQEPPAQLKSTGKFNSDVERQRITEKIAAGIYKNEEDYFVTRDNTVVPYGRGNV